MVEFDAFFRRVIGRDPPAVMHFVQGAQFSASRAALRSTPKETYQWIIELIEAGHLEVTFYLEMSWLYVLHGAAETEWDETFDADEKVLPPSPLQPLCISLQPLCILRNRSALLCAPLQVFPFLSHLAEARAELEANADSEELAADLLDLPDLALQHVMAHRGSPSFSSLLLAQLDTVTQEGLLPCTVQRDMDWLGDDLVAHATWCASSCMARCARHDHCTAYVFTPPPKESELPGRPARADS